MTMDWYIEHILAWLIAIIAGIGAPFFIYFIYKLYENHYERHHITKRRFDE